MIRALATVLVLLLPASAVFGQAESDRYEIAVQRIKKLCRLPHVRAIQPGKTSSGRAIPAFVVADFSSNTGSSTRVLICAGQHGDEYNPVQSVLSLCTDIASGAKPSLLSRCVFVVVPMANPDGIAFRTRTNSQGLDTNRDWLTLQTPEAAYIDSIVRAWKPHVMIDAHEWMESTSLPANGVELAQCVERSQSAAMAAVAKQVERASGLTPIPCSARASKQLFHRRYCMRGYAAFLVETAWDEHPEAKDRQYRAAIETIASAAGEDHELARELSPASSGFEAQVATASLLQWPAPRPAAAAKSTVVLGLLVMAGYSLFVWLIKPQRERHKTHTKPPTLHPRRPDLQTANHPMLSSPVPPPLTSAGAVKPLVGMREEHRRSGRKLD